MKNKKQQIYDKLESMNFEQSLQSLMDELKELKKQYGKKYLKLEFQEETHYEYDSEYKKHYLIGTRLETDEEFSARQKRDKEFKKEIETRERADFERLAKKYGNKNPIRRTNEEKD